MHMRQIKAKNLLNKTACYNNPSGKAAQNGATTFSGILHEKAHGCTKNCQSAETLLTIYVN